MCKRMPATCGGYENSFTAQTETVTPSQPTVAPIKSSRSSNVPEDNKDEENQTSNNVADARLASGKRKTQRTSTPGDGNEGDEEDLGANIPADICSPCIPYLAKKRKKDCETSTKQNAPQSIPKTHKNI